MLKFNRKKTVLQVLPSLFSGGVERGTVDISKTIVDSGMKSIVVSSGGPLASKISEYGGVHITIPTIASKNPFTIYNNIEIIEQICTMNDVDIIHARSRAPAWSCYFASKNLKLPFITTYHGTYSQNIIKKYYNQVMAMGDKVIAVSNYIKDYIISNHSTNEDKILIIPRGVDLQYFNPEAVSKYRIANIKNHLKLSNEEFKDKYIISMPARFTRWKGHNILLEAISKLNRDDVVIVMVGDNSNLSYIAEIGSLAKKLSIKNVIISDAVNDMPAIYAMSDIVVAPSVRPEAFGRIVTEAQAMGKIVIASDMGGTSETIIDSKTGFHFKTSDAEELARTINNVLDMPLEWKWKIGQNAMQDVREKYSLDIMKNSNLQLYHSIIETTKN